MRAMKQLLSSEGQCFIDVNHRYNAPVYGVFSTIARLIRDSISYKDENADVTASWEVGDGVISTYGHVFTDRELRNLVKIAGLEIEERIVVDYESGKIRRFGFEGSLLYAAADFDDGFREPTAYLLNFVFRELVEKRQSDDSIRDKFSVRQSQLRCAAPACSGEYWLQVQRSEVSASRDSFSQHRSTDGVTVSAGEFF